MPPTGKSLHQGCRPPWVRKNRIVLLGRLPHVDPPPSRFVLCWFRRGLTTDPVRCPPVFFFLSPCHHFFARLATRRFHHARRPGGVRCRTPAAATGGRRPRPRVAEGSACALEAYACRNLRGMPGGAGAAARFEEAAHHPGFRWQRRPRRGYSGRRSDEPLRLVTFHSGFWTSSAAKADVVVGVGGDKLSPPSRPPRSPRSASIRAKCQL